MASTDATTGEDLTLVEAVTDGLETEMDEDERVVLLGEDIGQNGGVFRATQGLIDTFGEDRVIDTPLAESAIVGTAVGMAAAGLKPVPEIQFMGFIYAAVDQLFTRAARIRTRSRGAYGCQMTVRAPYGAGIKVVVPSTPYDTKGLLTASIRDPDPVLFLEPKKIYRSFREPVPADSYEVPLGEATVRREGSDVSLFAWGAMTRTALDAAEALEGEVDVEVVDLRTLSPLDEAAILESVKKTGRAAVVHEAHKTGGLGGEVAATIQEEALYYLEAPVKRITGTDAVIPLYELEDFHLPNEQVVRHGLREVMDAGP